MNRSIFNISIMVHISSPDEALAYAFAEITETSRKTESYPWTWSVVPEWDTRTIHVDRLATQNWIESVAHTQRDFPGRVQFIIENATQRA